MSQDPVVIVLATAPMVDLIAEDLPQVENVGHVGVDARMLQDNIRSLENIIVPAPMNADAAPPPADEDNTIATATTTDQRALVVVESVVLSGKEGVVLEQVASKGVSEAGASFTQELIFAPLQMSGQGEVMKS